MMKSLKTKIAAPIAALAAALALTAVAPSIAQARPYNDARVEISYRAHNDFDFRGLERRIDQGVRTGDLTRREARRLNWQVSELRDLADRYDRNGMSRWQRRELSDRYQELSARVYYQKHDYQERDHHWR